MPALHRASRRLSPQPVQRPGFLISCSHPLEAAREQWECEVKGFLTAVILFVLTIVAIYTLLIRPWHVRWGATDAEAAASLPGDGLVSQPKISATHAVTVQASATDVWPWLVQIGQGRAGFYSYEGIENLLGLNIHNSDRILPEFQDLKVGDMVPLAADGAGVPVAFVEPNRSLVLGGRVDAQTKGPLTLEDKSPGAYYEASWAFFLQPVDARTTRLIERFRMDWGPETFSNGLFYRGILEPGSFIIERRMLLGIKERVETTSEPRAAQR
jgi:hypothetical protein